MKLSHAIELYLLAKEIGGFSPNTLRNYRKTLQRLCSYLLPTEPDVCDVTLNDLRHFVQSLQSSPPETRLTIPRELKPLGPKSIKNVQATLSSFWNWAVGETLTDSNIAKDLEVPQPKPGLVDPFDEAEIRALLRTARKTTERAIQLRDKAIVLFLLDTGVRASELCNLQIARLDLSEGTALVRGKGRLDKGQGKERRVVFGASTQLALRAYLLQRGEPSPKGNLFVTQQGKAVDRRHLSTHLRRLGLRAGVAPCYPHRFRHTFAIMYLRNGGDIYTLQRLLGHSSLDMVKRYLAIAQTDIESAHRRAGPVDNLQL